MRDDSFRAKRAFSASQERTVNTSWNGCENEDQKEGETKVDKRLALRGENDTCLVAGDTVDPLLSRFCSGLCWQTCLGFVEEKEEGQVREKRNGKELGGDRLWRSK